MRRLAFWASAILMCVPVGLVAQEAGGDPAEVVLGERLFLETRFAQFFKTFLDTGRGVNDVLPAGDPVMNRTVTTQSPLPGPFAGKAMNCRACHLVDEHVATPGGGMRTYADFAQRSPIPARQFDPAQTAPRNSPALVNAALTRGIGLLLHFDGEFVSLEDLIRGTFSGRNFGWQPGEKQQAIALLARVIREDDGQAALAADFGGLPYSVVLTGVSPQIPPEFRLPRQFRIEVARATDGQIFDAVARLVAAYTGQLVFSQDPNGAFNLSPFDVFLQRNDLPRKPSLRESGLDYGRRLLRAVNALDDLGRLKFVTSNPNTGDGKFEFHSQPFRFTREELEGMRIFFRQPSGALTPRELVSGGVGNCTVCHPAPNFTEFRLHNTGVTQFEYDGIHGRGSFALLRIPSLDERAANYNLFLPATDLHPMATGVFRSIPTAQNRMLTDLGAWNIFANPDFPKPQLILSRILCEDAEEDRSNRTNPSERCLPRPLLNRAIAVFKTPGLRDLSHSAPYMHNGKFNTIEEIIVFYREASDLSRAGTLRNPPHEFAGMSLQAGDVRPLATFLRALNEDYQ